jgi:hypothetical protein
VMMACEYDVPSLVGSADLFETFGYLVINPSMKRMCLSLVCVVVVCVDAILDFSVEGVNLATVCSMSLNFDWGVLRVRAAQSTTNSWVSRKSTPNIGWTTSAMWNLQQNFCGWSGRRNSTILVPLVDIVPPLAVLSRKDSVESGVKEMGRIERLDPVSTKNLRGVERRRVGL